MSYFKLSRMSSLLTVKTCAPVGFYVLWYVLIHDQEIISWSWPKPNWTFHVVYVPSYELVSLYWFLKGTLDLLDLSLGWWVSVCPYDTVCPYLHRRLASWLVSRLIAIIHSLTNLLDRMAYVTRPHIWSYQAWHQPKSYVEEKNLLILGHWTRV